jgi:hypothetical protein
VGEALTVSLYCFGLTIIVAARMVFPWLLVVLLKPMLSVYVPGPRLRAFEFTVNVMVFAVVVTVPDVDEAVSQLGVVVDRGDADKPAIDQAIQARALHSPSGAVGSRRHPTRARFGHGTFPELAPLCPVCASIR